MGTIHSVYTASLTLCVLFLVGVIFRVNSFSKRRSYRPEVIPPGTERVLILGASAGIGRTLAHRYAERGAKVCVVARKSAELEVVRSECEVRARAPDSALNICADITRAEDLVTIREAISEKWHGLDTLIVAAGVSALRPVLEIAGVEGPSITQPDLDGIRRVEDVALAAIKGNYLGPLLSVVTMIPFMRRTSASPSVLLISSLGAAIPAPTRAIYGSSKAASYILYQALSIENPSVNFSYVLPSTVEGNFRASAVDGGPVPEANPAQVGLKREVVAERCVRAIDTREKVVFVPAFYQFAPFLLWIWPSYVERKAAQKYRFAPT
ncbi:NAD(P)-binding protein [Russula dissimulans]|nr:NAD(P)-binding protein [Russula dissimulans]